MTTLVGRQDEEDSTPITQFLPLVCHQATALIVGLGGERARWTKDSRRFADTKRRLVGDVALSCAFVGYCGPFNQEFRDHLVKTRCDRINLQSNGVLIALDVASPLSTMAHNQSVESRKAWYDRRRNQTRLCTFRQLSPRAPKVSTALSNLAESSYQKLSEDRCAIPPPCEEH